MSDDFSLHLQILQYLVSKERAMVEVLNSGCVGALLTCLVNIKRATKSTVCIFDCLRSITRQDGAKLDFIRNDGIVIVGRHLFDLISGLSKKLVPAEEEMYANAANHCVCTYLELCNIDLARTQFANINLHQLLREFSVLPQTGKTARLRTNAGGACSLQGLYFA
jgi:hypothetical protein